MLYLVRIYLALRSNVLIAVATLTWKRWEEEKFLQLKLVYIQWNDSRREAALQMHCFFWCHCTDTLRSFMHYPIVLLTTEEFVSVDSVRSNEFQMCWYAPPISCFRCYCQEILDTSYNSTQLITNKWLLKIKYDECAGWF